ncbi:MAG: hypothetical protein JRG89_11760 [Deltaproteobacteria bacterium]|nr:hypothetical protein [Deltaproteobacteria bacterium]
MQNSIRPGVLFAIGFLILLPSASQAVRAPDPPQNESFSAEQREALGTLALADAPVRDAILEASLHPQKIEQIAAIAERSSAGFRARLDQVPRSKQKDIWELVRHPELIDALVLGGRPSRGSMDEILEPYPESVREIARRAALQDFDLLSDIAHLRDDAEGETAIVLASLPLASQASFEALIERPDIMTTLAAHPDLTRKLGGLYRVSPQRARATLDRHHDELVDENERAVAEWREIIEEDPEAREELLESAERFAEEEGYESPRAGTAEPETTIVHHYHHPYPYWFGPPHWYLGVHWYPYRAHWGFGFNLDGGIWIYGLPSPAFSYWHFGYARYDRSYSHLHSRWPRYARYNRYSHHTRHTRYRAGGHHERHLSQRTRRSSRPHDVVRANDYRGRRQVAEISQRSRRGERTRVARREHLPDERPIASSPRSPRRREVREKTVGSEPRRQVRARQTDTRQTKKTGERAERKQLEKRSPGPSHRIDRGSLRTAIMKKSSTRSHALKSAPKSDRRRSHEGKSRGQKRARDWLARR